MIPKPLPNRWAPSAHEEKTAKFYSTGTPDFHDVRAGSLNFGLWTREGMTYESAARELVMKVARNVNFQANDVVLDVGCGMGAAAVWILEEYPSLSICGLDVTPIHVTRAQERAHRRRISPAKLEFFYGSGTEIPFADKTFDRVYSIEAPEHMKTRADFFRETFRVLKPSGALCFTDYSLARPINNILERWLIRFAMNLWCVPEENLYGNDGFRQRLEQIGFVNVRIENIGRETIPGYFFGRTKWSAVKHTSRVRGFWMGVVGGTIIDLAVFMAYTCGLCEYIVVRTEKPGITKAGGCFAQHAEVL